MVPARYVKAGSDARTLRWIARRPKGLGYESNERYEVLPPAVMKDGETGPDRAAGVRSKFPRCSAQTPELFHQANQVNHVTGTNPRNARRASRPTTGSCTHFEKA